MVTNEKAKRNSRNCPAGTLETKPIVFNKDAYTDYLTTQVFSAIHAKFPNIRGTPVIVQQENDKLHISPIAAGIVWNGIHAIQLINQPPNSPKFSILDSVLL